mmetsp:Transcript_122453/g.305743  ORF Transcript_122453/g.305743 Transcript_122453/m.305743 type:complete len:139 (-) Transcript_122453:793-1209(-)
MPSMVPFSKVFLRLTLYPWALRNLAGAGSFYSADKTSSSSSRFDADLRSGQICWSILQYTPQRTVPEDHPILIAWRAPLAILGAYLVRVTLLFMQRLCQRIASLHRSYHDLLVLHANLQYLAAPDHCLGACHEEHHQG